MKDKDINLISAIINIILIIVLILIINTTYNITINGVTYSQKIISYLIGGE